MRRSRGFRPGRGIAFAPRSKPDLARLSDDELAKLAPAVGVEPAADRTETIRRISEQGVAYVASKSNRSAGDPNDAGYDPDAQAIADESLKNLPAGHPGWNDTIAPEVLRAPDQVDEAPTSDHRAPEGRDSGKSMNPDKPSDRAGSSMFEHDTADETEVAGELRETDTSGAVADSGEALKAKGKK